MFSPRITVAVLASVLPLGVGTAAAAAPGEQQPTQTTRQAPERGTQGAPAEQMTPQERAAALDIEEWITAWNQLPADKQDVLVTAWKRVVGELQGLAPEQEMSLENALETMISELALVYRNLTPDQRQSVQRAARELQSAYMDLSVEQKAAFLNELASTVKEAKPMQQRQTSPQKAPARGSGAGAQGDQ